MFSVENEPSGVGYLTCIKARKATNSLFIEMITLNSSTMFCLQFLFWVLEILLLPPSPLNLPVGTGQQRAAEPLCRGLQSADGAVAAELLPIHILNPFFSLSVISIISVTEGAREGPHSPSPSQHHALGSPLGPAPGLVQSVGPLSTGPALTYNWYQMRRPDRSPGFMSFWPVRLLLTPVPRCQGTDEPPAAVSMVGGNELSATRERPGMKRKLSSPLEG